MKELSKYFDHYTIFARFMPAFFTVLPIVIVILVWYPDAKTLLGGTITLLISFGVMSLLSSVISNIGNKIQTKLFLKWGGAPTTTILRFSDDILDEHTKRRYHRWFENKLENLTFPSESEEIDNPDEADQKYISAINYLREFTRDKNKFPMVYSDNVAYGFSRNLLAIKPFGLMMAISSFLVNIVFVAKLLKSENITVNESISNSLLIGFGSVIISLLCILIFIFIVNHKFVQARAIRYAKSLLGICEL